MTDNKTKKECIELPEDIEDLKAAEEALKSVDLNDTVTLEDLCNEEGIDYKTL
ncbi:MAG: hypothetical protein IJJ00_02525 [Erysipelotrichaceae bacterium]|nr:hypothetical protein [Erysipelotrichaceae bacterium]